MPKHDFAPGTRITRKKLQNALPADNVDARASFSVRSRLPMFEEMNRTWWRGE
jgi:hypothetical protein